MKGEIIEKKIILYRLKWSNLCNIIHAFRDMEIECLEFNNVKKTSKNYSVSLGGRNYYCRTNQSFYCNEHYCFISDIEHEKEAYFEFIKKVVDNLNEYILKNNIKINSYMQLNANLEIYLSDLK